MKRLAPFLVVLLLAPASAGASDQFKWPPTPTPLIDWADRVPIPRHPDDPPIDYGMKGDKAPTQTLARDKRWAHVLPPPRYDYKPTVPTHVEVLPWDLVQAICGRGYPAGRGPWGACATVGGKVCIIYWPERRPAGVEVGYEWAPDDILLRHEEGHCNGWPGHHPR